MSAAGQGIGEDTGLRRSLRFWDLVLYGIILIQPTAPMPSFGVIYHEANGHVITAILLAMVASAKRFIRVLATSPAGAW
jgi:hypothetical protein